MNLFELIENMNENPKLRSLEEYPAISKNILTVLEVMGHEVREALNKKQNVTLVGLGHLLPLSDKRIPNKQVVRFRASRILTSTINLSNESHGEEK